MNIEKIKNFMEENDKFIRLGGIDIEEVKEGYAKTVVRITKNHLNAASVVNGGLIFTLADLAFAAAANSSGKVALAIDAHIHFLSPSREGDILTAEAKQISKSRRVSTYHVEVKNHKGELIATFTGTAYTKEQTFEF